MGGFLNNENSGPLMFIETYRDEIKEDFNNLYDSRKNKNNISGFDNIIINNFKIYRYEDILLIPFKKEKNKIYALVISKVEGNILKNITLTNNEFSKLEEFKQ